jgi:hypothetical protein
MLKNVVLQFMLSWPALPTPAHVSAFHYQALHTAILEMVEEGLGHARFAPVHPQIPQITRVKDALPISFN